MSNVELSVVDYILAGIFLCVSAGIGIFYGVCKKAKSNDDYFYGNRQMPLFPVALSLLVTFQSANSVLGLPAEVYTYNAMFFYNIIGIALATVVTSLTIVPLLYPLKLNSAYEYLGRRFNSRSVQLLGTLIGMLQTLLYMSTVLFAPALAIEAGNQQYLDSFVAGIPLWASVIGIGVLGTIYTSLGGYRSVIWTDVFQFIIMYGGVVVILVLGVNTVGSLGKILDIAKQGDRLQMNTSFDPRVRHSLCGCVIGSMFTWFPNIVQQSGIQRMASVRSQRDAKIAFLLNAPFCLLYGAVLLMAGLVFYAYFTVEQCGPVENGYIGSANQVMPYFVMLILQNIPGLAGIFLSALFSGTLSSLSSGINALTANTLQDILINYTQQMSQAKQTLLARVIVVVYGTVAVVIAYFLKNIKGTLTQIASTAVGACGGPYFGMFCLGAMFPQTNWIGAFLGGVAGIIFNVWLAISAIFYALPAPKSPVIPTSGCILISSINQSTTLDPYAISQYNSTDITDSIRFLESTIDSTFAPYVSLPAENRSMSGIEYLYNVSYVYLGITGFLVSVTVGLIVSLCSGGNKNRRPDSKYIFPCLRLLWGRYNSQCMDSYYLTGETARVDEQTYVRKTSRL